MGGKREKKERPRGGLVYSTVHGEHCPRCGAPVAQCACAAEAPPPPPGSVARVRREVAGRRGKQVTTAAGLPLTAAGLAELAAELKRRCGCGGSVKEGTVVLQGDVVEAVAAELAARGFRVRRG